MKSHKHPEDRILDDTHKRLIKQYHTLCGILGMSSDDKSSLLANLRVSSSRDLTEHQLIDLCARLSDEIAKSGGHASLNRMRRRLIGCIGRYIELIGYDRNNLAMIKAIATRAAGVEHFNDIPRDRLRSLYGAFSNRAKDVEFVQNQKLNNQQ